MASSRVVFINLAGLAQGLALVTVPALAPVLTGSVYGLSSSAYGALFLPQALTAIAGSLLGSRLEARHGPRRLALTGLTLDALAMASVLLSAPAAGTAVGFALLVLATASLGLGFGLCVPALNVLIATERPAAVDRATLTLNALLGLGTALAPLLSALFVGLGIWWALPLVALVGLLLLLFRGRSLQLAEPPRAVAAEGDATSGVSASARATRPTLPPRTAVFLCFALLYGIVETINGNWSTLYAQDSLGATAAIATLALAAFWGSVTVGRILFATIERRVPLKVSYRALPFVAAAGLLVAALLPRLGGGWGGVLAFGVAGLGCSALLPLTISFAESELTAVAAAVSGLVFAAYQVGYGMAAFGVGPLMDRLGLSLSGVMALGALIAVVLGGVALAVVGRRGPAVTVRAVA